MTTSLARRSSIFVVTAALVCASADAYAQAKPAAPATPPAAKPAAPAPAPAGPTPPKSAADKKKDAEARAAFRKAVGLYDKKDFASALPIFMQVHEQLHSPNAMLYIARCQRELKRLTEAWESFGAVARLANTQVTKDAAYEETRDAALAEAAAIEPSISRVTLVVDDPPPDLVVEVDGKPIAPERFGTVMAFMPGKLMVTARAPERRDFKNEVVLREGASLQVTIALKKEGELEAGIVIAPPPPKETGGDIRTLGFVVAGVGVVGATMFVITRLMGDSEFEEMEQACGQGQCSQTNFENRKKSGETLDLLANVGLVVGGVGLIAGGLMIAFGGKKIIQPMPKTGFVWGPTSVGYRGTF